MFCGRSWVLLFFHVPLGPDPPVNAASAQKNPRQTLMMKQFCLFEGCRTSTGRPSVALHHLVRGSDTYPRIHHALRFKKRHISKWSLTLSLSLSSGWPSTQNASCNSIISQWTNTPVPSSSPAVSIVRSRRGTPAQLNLWGFVWNALKMAKKMATLSLHWQLKFQRWPHFAERGGNEGSGNEPLFLLSFVVVVNYLWAHRI